MNSTPRGESVRQCVACLEARPPRITRHAGSPSAITGRIACLPEYTPVGKHERRTGRVPMLQRLALLTKAFQDEC